MPKESWHFICPFQIRAEKPYYVADPEVDSLVSTNSSTFNNSVDTLQNLSKDLSTYTTESILFSAFPKISVKSQYHFIFQELFLWISANSHFTLSNSGFYDENEGIFFKLNVLRQQNSYTLFCDISVRIVVSTQLSVTSQLMYRYVVTVVESYDVSGENQWIFITQWAYSKGLFTYCWIFWARAIQIRISFIE